MCANQARQGSEAKQGVCSGGQAVLRTAIEYAHGRTHASFMHMAIHHAHHVSAHQVVTDTAMTASENHIIRPSHQPSFCPKIRSITSDVTCPRLMIG